VLPRLQLGDAHRAEPVSAEENVMRRVTLTLEWTGENADAMKAMFGSPDIGQLLRDALGEFREAREKPDYVDDRYPNHRYATWKRSEVIRRCEAARLLSLGDITLEDHGDDEAGE
jgi:hypothetical protein